MAKNKAAIVLIALGVILLIGVNMVFHIYHNDAMREGFLDLPAAMSRPPLYSGTAGIVGGIVGVIVAFGAFLFMFDLRKEVKKHDITAFLFIALGVFAILGITTVFYPCRQFVPSGAAQVLRPMRCFFTMRVLIATIGAYSIVGVFMLLYRQSKAAIKGFSITAILLTVLFYIHSSVATGMCPTPTMECVTDTRPFLSVIIPLMAIFSAVNTFFVYRKNEDEDDAETADNS